LIEQGEDIRLDKIPKFLKKDNWESIRVRDFFGTKSKNSNSNLLLIEGPINVLRRLLTIWINKNPACKRG